MMILFAILHCGQLNSTTSSLLILALVKDEYIYNEELPNIGCCSIMSCLAQVFPSSAMSVGMTPSNRRLEAGDEHVDKAFRFRVTSEQCPVADDPFAASTPSVEKLKCDGITMHSGQ